MASITATAAISIPSPNRDNIGMTTVNINYMGNATWSGRGTDESPPGVAVGTHVWHTYQYSEISYSWTFSPSGSASNATGSTIISNLSPKNSQQIYGILSASGTETITTWTRVDTREWIESGYLDERIVPDTGHGNPGDEDYEPPDVIQVWVDTSHWSDPIAGTPSSSTTTNTVTGTATSNNITVYTRPGIFTEYNFTADTIIESADGLTATKVSHWIDHCNAFAHWYNQNGTNVTTSACGATTGDVITAAWYNACIAACPDVTTRPAAVTGGIDGTILSASIFSSLGAAISKDDT